MNPASFDLIVIGGGPGGYVAAIRAAQLGMKAAVVEREHPGGICSNWGCIPTKALLHAADVYREIQHAGTLGLQVQMQGAGFDFGQVVARSREVAQKMNTGVRHLLKKNKVTLLEGEGKLAGSGQVEVLMQDGLRQQLRAPHVIIATGARARELPGLAVDGERIWSYRQALQPPVFPKQLVVLGGGAIGMEFASFYATLGSKVTVVEQQARVLPQEDAEISAAVQKAFEKQGISVRTGTTVNAAVRHGDGLMLTLSAGGTTSTLEASHLLVSAGVVGNVEGLGLEKTRVRTERGHIVIDSACRTGEPGVYAIGDVAGPPWLAHKASHEGVLCVEAIAGLPVHALDPLRIPACTYCHPQVASVGLTEEQARATGRQLKVGRFPFVGNGRATALGAVDGMIKTVFDAQTGELLGSHMVGAGVTELIHGMGLAATLEATEAELMETIYPHPTLSEAVHESVLAAFGRALHI
ncbi:dihydrolipoyl dehydrogenase [Lacisediminimonas profundi]|uniref:dihydrolipoyl dehydrogenase n=1 Tax=Lacisediminimonas profundi TaxID=2603856 RepID=UPI00124B3B67|nr:dihydrolipoyl dehydrogenase [Lacisediminimonas profundi]